MTFVRWLFGFLLTLVLLLLVAVIVLPRVIDPNDYRDDIAQLVSEKTGRELSIAGDLSMSVFPWLGVETGAISLSQPAPIGGEFLSTQAAQLRVKFLPLLSKRLEVDTIVLNKPRIELITLADGTSSLDGLVNDAPETENPDAAETAALALVIEGVQIDQATLILDDRGTGSRTELRELNLSSGDLLSGASVPVTVSGVLQGSDNEGPLQFDLAANVQLDAQKVTLTAQGLNADVDLSGQSIKATINNINYQDGRISLNDLNVEAGGDWPIKASTPDVSIDLNKEQISAASVSAEMLGVAAQMNELAVTGFGEPKYKASINLPDTSLRPLIKALEIDYAPLNSAALESVSLKTSISGDLSNVALTDISLQLDQTSVQGRLALANFSQPASRFDLRIDQINVDDYLPESQENTEPELAAAETIGVPMVVFRQLNANGRLRVDQLRSAGVTMSDIDVQVQSEGDRFTVTPTAKLYDGRLLGQLAYTGGGQTDELRVQQKVDLVDLGRLLSDADISDQLRGIGSLDVDLLIEETAGQQINSGTIKLSADKGAFSGLDINQVLVQANSILSLLNSKENAQEADAQVDGEVDKASVTEFASMTGTFLLDNYVLRNNDFAMQAPAFSVRGEGTIDIAAQTLDYVATLQVAESIPGELGAKLDKVLGKSIPIRCQGALESPLCLPDTKQLYALYLDSRLKQKQGELLQDKFGVEGGEQLSTKEALKQVLINKALNKDKEKRQQQNAQEQQGQVERPIGERSEEQADDAANESELEQENPEEEESLEDKLKRELLERLLN